LLPKRALSHPVSGMAMIEPMPRHNSSSPNCASSTPTRALANGTSGAQHAMTNPAARNDSRVASRVSARSAEWIIEGKGLCTRWIFRRAKRVGDPDLCSGSPGGLRRQGARRIAAKQA